MTTDAAHLLLPPLERASLLDAVARVVREVRTECQTASEQAATRAELAAAADVSRALLADQAERLHAEFADVIQHTLTGEAYAATLAAAIQRETAAACAELASTVQRATALAGQVECLADDIAYVRAELGAVRSQRAGLADAVAALATPTPWAQGGIGYRERALVGHRGGLWVACEDTHAEPGTGGAWALVADGVAALAAGTGAPGELALTVTMASGRELSLQAPLPRWTARGLWKGGESYRADELVTYDGCTWLALEDAPAAAPPSPGWQCVAMRGARGRRGEAGEPGAPGPMGARGPRGASAPTIDSGVALRAWRGKWSGLERYDPGDLVLTHNGVYVCTEPPPGGAPRDGDGWSRLSGGGT